MKTNVGGIDRAGRIVIGLGLLSIIVVVDGSLRWLGLIGIVPLLTGLVGNCPVYTMLGFDTCHLPGSRM